MINNSEVDPMLKREIKQDAKYENAAVILQYIGNLSNVHPLV